MPKSENKEAASSLPLNKALVRQSGDLSYPAYQTHLQGVAVRMEDGLLPKSADVVDFLGKSTIRGLLNSSRKIFSLSRRIANMNKEKDLTSSYYKDKAVKTGFRGLRAQDFSITVFPSYKFTDWNKSLLRTALGPAYDQIVTEKLELEITMPKGQEKCEEPVTVDSLRQNLIAFLAGRLSCSDVEVQSMVGFNDIVEVDTKSLGTLIGNGRVSLPEETANVIETWSVTPKGQ